MKISAKSRYALASLICLAQAYPQHEYVTLSWLANQLGISKLYLEQVFTLLKHQGLVVAIKGSQGGYLLARPPAQITVLDIMQAIETALFVSTDATVETTAPAIEKALHALVFQPLDDAVQHVLVSVTLADLLTQTEKNSDNANYMYYL